MGAKPFEAHLYYKFKLVGLKPTDRVNLLDLLVRVRGGTFGGTRILNLGSFLLYNRPCPTATDADAEPDDDPDAEDYASYAGEIEQGLRILEAGEYDDLPKDGIFKVHQDLSVHTQRISTSTGLFSRFLHLVTAGCSTGAEVQCIIKNLSYHAVIDSAINDLFVGDEPSSPAPVPPLWKPDMRKISRACHPREGGDDTSLEIWIVREKDLCEDLRFEGVQETSANAAFTADGTSQAVAAKANRRAAVSRETTGFHQLGFKAVRLFYNDDGDLLKWRPDMGDSVPTLRDHEEDNPSYHDQYQDYHLGAFFDVEPPPTRSTKPDDVSNVTLELLDIQPLQPLAAES